VLNGFILVNLGFPPGAVDIVQFPFPGAWKWDKKNEKGSIRWVLLREVGQAVSRADVPNVVVSEVLSWVIKD